VQRVILKPKRVSQETDEPMMRHHFECLTGANGGFVALPQSESM